MFEEDVNLCDADHMLVLAGKLNSMRDLLVELSLLLRDAQFNLDTAKRDAAASQLQNILKKINARL